MKIGWIVDIMRKCSIIVFGASRLNWVEKGEPEVFRVFLERENRISNFAEMQPYSTVQNTISDISEPIDSFWKIWLQ